MTARTAILREWGQVDCDAQHHTVFKICPRGLSITPMPISRARGCLPSFICIPSIQPTHIHFDRLQNIVDKFHEYRTEQIPSSLGKA